MLLVFNKTTAPRLAVSFTSSSSATVNVFVQGATGLDLNWTCLLTNSAYA